MGERITTNKARNHVANHLGINIAKRRAALLADDWDDLSANLFCDALDLAADLIAARETIASLTADLAAARNFRGAVTAETHARAVRSAWADGVRGQRDIGHDDSPTRARLLLTLRAAGIPDAQAVALADGEVTP